MPPDKKRVGASTATSEGRFIPGGAAFLLARFDEKTGKTFGQVSPYKIRDRLVTLLGSAVTQVDVSALRSGALLLKTSNFEQSTALMGWDSFDGLPLKVIPAENLNQVEGMVYAPELTGEPVSTILRESEAQGVTSVTRLPSKTDRPNPLLKIRFCKTMLPSHLKASYIRYEVRPCMPLPRRCPRCLRYGHGRKTCKGRTRCRRCAGEHEADGCEAPPHCAACQGDHEVTDKACPVWVSKVEAIRANSQSGSMAPNREGWPPLPTPQSAGSSVSGRRPPARQPWRPKTASVPEPEPARSSQGTTQTPAEVSNEAPDKGEPSRARKDTNQRSVAAPKTPQSYPRSVSPSPAECVQTNDIVVEDANNKEMMTPVPGEGGLDRRVNSAAQRSCSDPQTPRNSHPRTILPRALVSEVDATSVNPSTAAVSPVPDGDPGTDEWSPPSCLSGDVMAPKPKPPTHSNSATLMPCPSFSHPAGQPMSPRLDITKAGSDESSMRPVSIVQKPPQYPLRSLPQNNSYAGLDSDDSVLSDAGDDEGTPRAATVAISPRTPFPEYDAEPSPPTPPTQRRRISRKCCQKQVTAVRKNMGYRTPQRVKRSFVPDNSELC